MEPWRGYPDWLREDWRARECVLGLPEPALPDGSPCLHVSASWFPFPLCPPEAGYRLPGTNRPAPPLVELGFYFPAWVHTAPRRLGPRRPDVCRPQGQGSGAAFPGDGPRALPSGSARLASPPPPPPRRRRLGCKVQPPRAGEGLGSVSHLGRVTAAPSERGKCGEKSREGTPPNTTGLRGPRGNEWGSS